MFDVFAKCATDPTLELNGSWQDIGEGSSLLIARANNRRYTRLLNKLIEQNQEVLDETGTDEADDKSDEIMVEVFSETILLGWKSLAYQGQQIEYSKDNARMVLKHADFRNMVARKSQDAEAYRVKQEEKQGKA